MDHSNLDEITQNIIDSTMIDDKLRPLVESESKVVLESIRNFKDEITLPISLIKSLRVENFGSVKEMDLDFSSLGSASILGAVGSGKSTILRALSFALYGGVVEKLSQDDLIPITFPSVGATLTICLESSGSIFRIIRTLKHEKLGSSLTIIQEKGGSSSEIKKSSMRETQKFIVNLIGLSFDDFTTLCYYYQKKSSFFGIMTPARQSELLLKFLGGAEKRIEYLSDFSKKQLGSLKESFFVSAGSISSTEAQKTELTARLNDLKNFSISESVVLDLCTKHSILDPKVAYDIIANTELDIEEKAKSYLSLVFKYHGSFDSISVNLAELNKKFSTVRESRMSTSLKLTKLRTSYQDLVQRINSYQRELSALVKNICPTCDRAHEDAPDRSSLDKLRGAIKESKAKLLVLIENGKLDKELVNSLENESELLKSKVSKLSFIQATTQQFKRLVNTLGADVSSEVKSLESGIKDAIDRLKLNIAEQEDNKRRLDAYKILSTDIFSNKGITAKVLESIGIRLSSYMNNILQESGSEIKIKINTVTFNKSGGASTKLEVLVDFGDGSQRSYSMLSGGQSAIIDTLSIVSFYNILSNIYGLENGILGVLCLDEIIQFVDSSHIELIKSILRSSIAKTNLLVTHLDDLKTIYQNRINVENKDGISKYSTYLRD